MNQIPQAPTLNDLPAPPPGRIGWPWTEQNEPLPEKMPDGSDWPKISIVTPSYNQGQFIEETILSVLNQSYPNLEYIVIDGGSTDGSVEIIQKYDKYLHYWISEKDSGPWEAILKGFSMSTGSWFNWLNSDDLLLEKGLHRIAYLIKEYCEPQNYNWLSCARLDISENGIPLRSTCPWYRSINHLAFSEPFFPQDATWIRAESFKRVSSIVPKDLKNIFDTCLHDILLSESTPLLSNSIVSAMRWHDSQLTANKKQLSIEVNRSDVNLIRPRKTFIQRLIQRGTRTRFFIQAIQLTRLLMSLNLLGHKEYTAVIYSPYERRDKIMSATEAFLTSNY
jgi:glycosyltransferase involved in cell wall biosynthesis